MEIKPAALDKLKKSDATRKAKVDDEARQVEDGDATPTRVNGKGFSLGRENDRKPKKRVQYVMDTDMVDEVEDELCPALKKATGRKVSASEVVRTSVRAFLKLSRKQQIELLEK